MTSDDSVVVVCGGGGSSSGMIVLPTAEDIRRVSISMDSGVGSDVKGGTTSATIGSLEQQRQRLVMQALNYGTGLFDSWKETQHIVDASAEQQTNAEQIIPIITSARTTTTTAKTITNPRALEAGMVLTKAWVDCPILEDYLVDGLWLCSSLITTTASLPHTASTLSTSSTSSTSSSSMLLEQSMKGLITIIKALLTVPNREQFYIKLQSTLFPSLLDSVGLGSEQDLLKRLKVHNTQIHYKQHKFSLLQEESEGYSKLLHFLTTPSTTKSTTKTCKDDDDGSAAHPALDASINSEDLNRRERVLQIMGTYELDPNRVLDLTFDALEERLFTNTTNNYNINNNSTDRDLLMDDQITNGSKLLQEQHLHHHHNQQRQQHLPKVSDDIDGLLDVIRALPLTNFSSLLAFKLNNATTIGGEVGSTTTMSLSTVRTVAFIASQGFIHLEALMEEYFDPVDGAIENAHKIYWMKEKERVLSAARVSLSGGTTATNGTTTTPDDPKQLELQERLTVALEPLNKSFPLSIMLILIRWGKWDQVKTTLSATSWSHVCCLLPQQFGSALCDEAQARIMDWYAKKVGTPNLNETWDGKDDVTSSKKDCDDDDVIVGITVDQVVQAISDPLSCIVQSGYIAFRPILFCRICRLLSSLLGQSANNTEKESEEEMESHHNLTPETCRFFQTFLVPSLSLFLSNAALSNELWTVLKHLPYTMRYKLYSNWRGTGLEKAGLSSSWMGKPLPNVLSEIEAGKSARYVLKRLSKDNIRDMSRQLATVTHSNPLVVYATILSQIESYDNMVEVMVEAQRFVDPLGLDVLGYCILGRLSGMTGGMNRSRLKGMNHKRNSSSFSVSFLHPFST
jgi:THO complex subunit 2